MEQSHIACRWCGQVHRPIELRRGERALCTNCGSTLLRRTLSGGDAALAFTVTALILSIPAAQLPLVTVQKFGAAHESYLWTGIRALWQDGMPLLSVWVALCGIVVPVALLTTLVVLISARHWRGSPPRFWTRVAGALQRWSMPEVQVLAVLVAFVKIGALVQVDPGAGLWFYAAVAVCTLMAWRSAELWEAVR